MSFWSRYSFKKELRNTFLIGLIGFPFLWFWCRTCFNDWDLLLIAGSYSSFQWVLLWQGNAYLSDYTSYKFNWLKAPGKRFIWGLVGVLLYTPLAVYGLYALYKYIFEIDVDGINTTMLFSIVITFMISFFLNARDFLINWRQTALDAERLKKEQMATRYESLKNQVNPHFLFNSLNALTNLVYEDQDQAARFIRELSKVYRYVLDTRSQEVVSLKTEMDFVESYIFLQKIRFDDKLKMNIQVSGSEQKMVPPMSIQMLLENALKHNTVAEEEPLNIEIYVESETMLVVKNNLQKKNIPTEESSGMGLTNIKSRYEFLSHRTVEIIDGPNEFIVKLPLLNFEK